MLVDEKGRIESLGIESGPKIKNKINLNGRLVLPGFIDSHIHLYSLGRASSRINLQNCTSLNTLKETVSAELQNNRSEWIVGYGWHQDNFEEHRYPTRLDLDEIQTDKPMVLIRACHHIGVVNTRALEILQLLDQITDIPGGKIDVDENGQANGILREKALGLVTPFIENRSDHALMEEYIRKAIDICVSFGITSVQTNDPESVEVYKQLAAKDKLPIRVFLTLPQREALESDYEPLSQFGNLQLSRVKIFADGSLGASTAALIEPYSDDPHNLGILVHSNDNLLTMMQKLNNIGWRIETHAIGDKATQQIINILAKLDKSPHRPLITHVQILNLDLIFKMKEMGIIANIQPIFVPTDKRIAEARLGSRIQYAYAWKSLLENNVMISGGSDAPIESSNPLLGIYAAMFRKINPTDNSWQPQESLTFDESLQLFTYNGAFACLEEENIGSLKPGYKADFIVLEKDVISDPDLLLTCNVEAVYVGGKQIK